MRLLKTCLTFSVLFTLSACTLTPEQQAERAAQKLRTQQALQVKLAAQCDIEASELMKEQFDPPIGRTEKEEQIFKEKYAQKVGDPTFQACYKLALENYKTQLELERMRYEYDYFHPRFSPWGYCHSCW